MDSSKKPGKLAYSKFGDPLNELEIVEDQVPTTLQPGQVHVRVLYAPIHPHDFITVMGYFPIKPPLPAVPGIEGIVEVVRSNGNAFKPGDRAVLQTLLCSLWRQEFVTDEKCLYKVPPKIPIEAAATLVVNPCTAYLMLHEIVPLKRGDCVIQNAANSALGQVLIQLAKVAGIKTINVIRNRPDLKETVEMLKELGADVVITEEQLAKGLKSLNLGVPAPKLALECVGGKAAGDMLAALDFGGTLATFGIMSGQPITVDQMAVIGNNLRVVGFTLNSWIDNEKRAEDFPKVIEKIVQFYLAGHLRLPRVSKFPMHDWREAIKMAGRGYTNTKVLLELN